MDAYGQQELSFVHTGPTEHGRRKPSYRKGGFSNLYFALLPDDNAAGHAVTVAGELRARYGLRSEQRPRQLLHVSLCSVGEWVKLPEDIVFAAKAAAACVQMAPFKLSLNRALSFRQPGHPFVLCAEEGREQVTTLRRQLAVELFNHGVNIALNREFEPHLTLLYDRRQADETTLPTPVCWNVTEIVLVESLVGKGQHRHLDHWPLIDQSQLY